MTTIDAIGVATVQVVLSEYGPDLSRFASEKEFVSHLTLAPAPTDERRQAAPEETAQHGEYTRNRCVTNGRSFAPSQRPPWGLITAELHAASGAMLRCSLRPGNWPL